jgi:hypothetical protein
LATGLLAGLLKQSVEKEHAEKLLATLRGTPPLGMIIYHVVCSETDAAIDWYEHAIEQPQPFAAGGPLRVSLELCAPVRAGSSWRR